MIRLQRITTADTDLYSYMEKLMTQSFPSEEYRELEELRKYTDTKTHFYNNIIFHNN
ncbi:GNAT family N-acetyltransferase, partial [Bifidobacterium pseudocatenulatum]|nr:GNAT family N-acetyltransferase [Bifidobacterium pseudocatenulatum]